MCISKKLVAWVAVFAILAAGMVGCQRDQNSPRELDYARYGTTKEEVQAQNDRYGKFEGRSYEMDEFVIGEVIVSVYPFALDYTYSEEDFSEIGCVDIRGLSYYPDNEPMPTKFMVLEISDDTKQGVLDAIELLLQREDVYSAQPNFIGSIN